MLKKFGLALLVLFTPTTMLDTGWAASNTTQIQVSNTPVDYMIARPESDGHFHNGLLLAERSDGTLVYYNTKGDIAFTLPEDIEPITGGDFHEQRALVINTKTNLLGYINTNGDLAIPCQFTSAGYFSEGIAHVTMANSSEQTFIDRTGKVVTHFTEDYSSDYYFTNGLAIAYAPQNFHKIGYINTKGKLAIQYQYTYARGFSEGLALVQISSKGFYGYIDTTGKVTIPLRYQAGGDFSEGLAPVQNTKGKWGFIDKKGKIIIPFRYSHVNDFSEGLAAVYNSQGKVGFINTKGQLVIAYQKYNRASKFKEGIALVGITTKSDPVGKFGYINRQGKLLTKLEYMRESSSFSNGSAVALKSMYTAFILTTESPSQ